jgi:hypothetical protein
MNLLRTSRCVIQLWSNVTQYDGSHLKAIEILIKLVHDMDFLRNRNKHAVTPENSK